MDYLKPNAGPLATRQRCAYATRCVGRQIHADLGRQFQPHWPRPGFLLMAFYFTLVHNNNCAFFINMQKILNVGINDGMIIGITM